MVGDAGEHPTFDEAFDEVFNLAFSVGLRMLTDRHDAQDVAAETAARAMVQWRKLAALPHRQAWVSRVAANVAVDQIRKRHPRGELVRDPVADPEHMPDHELAELLTGLPRRQREVLALRYVLDLPDAEIARSLGLSEGSVKKHGARGLASLRRRLTAQMTEVSVAY